MFTVLVFRTICSLSQCSVPYVHCPRVQYPMFTVPVFMTLCSLSQCSWQCVHCPNVHIQMFTVPGFSTLCSLSQCSVLHVHCSNAKCPSLCSFPQWSLPKCPLHQFIVRALHPNIHYLSVQYPSVHDLSVHNLSVHNPVFITPMFITPVFSGQCQSSVLQFLCADSRFNILAATVSCFLSWLHVAL